jgi:hypothetical protein
MALRAWKALGISAVLAGGVIAGDKPADLPVRPEVTGKVPPAVTQDLNLPEPAKPARNGVTSFSFSGNLLGLPTPRQPAPDGDIPIDDLQKAKLAFDTAETHRIACELSEAERWYQETIRQAPRSTFASTATERLKNLRTTRFTPQSEEPPLAANSPELPTLQLRVLWEAARQYREAVESGDAVRIDRCARSLDGALKVTKQ